MADDQDDGSISYVKAAFYWQYYWIPPAGNLTERGLTWTPGITETTGFIDVVREIRGVFPSL